MTSLRTAPDPVTDNAELDGLIEATLEVARHDAALRRDLKAAIQHDDVAQTLQAACALVGVEPSGSILALILSPAKAVA